MNVVFLGYKQWAYRILKNLLNEKSVKWILAACITIPKPEADYAKLSLPCFPIDPQNLAKESSYEQIIEKYKPAVFLAYGWSWILPPSVYKNHVALILHPSPLPKYRGGSPLQHQIIAGEKTSATTIFQADEGIDTGPIYAQSSFSLSGHMDDIFNRIIELGTKDTIKVLDGIADNALQPIPQDKSKASYCKRRKPEESELKLDDFKIKTAEEIYNFIRALEDPYPSAFIRGKDGKKLLIKKAALENK